MNEAWLWLHTGLALALPSVLPRTHCSLSAKSPQSAEPCVFWFTLNVFIDSKGERETLM